MHLFTSSSRRELWHLLFGLWAFCALLGFGRVFAPDAAADADIINHDDPAAWGSFYLAHDRGGHIDHHVLYHGIDDTARDQMRAADVLFLGNSRLMFALESRIARTLLADVNYYILGFGHEEQDDFPLRLIREHDLRPRLVVVNADQFFVSQQSEWATRVVGETPFDAWKIRVEGTLAHRVRKVVHRVVPHYVDLRRGQREVVLYRSREDGSWFVANDFGEGTSFRWPQEGGGLPTADDLRSAEAFKRELDVRGTKLVLCVVPAPEASLQRAQAIAAHLSVPLIVPSVEDLRTIDNSHLSYESAARVAAALVTSLRPHLP